MGKLKEFQIRLASNQSIYRPGDVVTGDLLVRLESPMELRGIRIKFCGEAYVHWTEQETRGTGENRHTVTVHYSGRERLFHHKITVVGKDKDAGDSKMSLSQGEHVYPFSFQLPGQLPTSYEDHIGRVRYEVKAVIDRPWKIDDRTRRLFTVLETVDLNNVQNALEPAIGDETKHLCCLCCKSGPIKVDFQADRSAYVPGEFVTINATLKNKSNSKVKKTSASLMQKLTYHASRKSKIRWVDMGGLEGKECRKKETIAWTNERLQIPAVPPTTTTASCRVLEIEYYLMFRGHMRTCAIDLRELEAITIGTVPLTSLDMYRNIEEELQVAPVQDVQSVLPNTIGDETTQQISLPPMAVPPRAIYRDAFGGAVNLAAEDDSGRAMSGDQSFSPQYTFYDWSQTSFTYN